MREEGKPQPTRGSAGSECRGARGKREPAPSDTDPSQLNLLRRQYRSLTGKAVHPSVPRFLLARAVAYERQIREHGDLPARVACALAAAAREELGPGQPSAGPDSGRPPRPSVIRSGTILVREHGNVLHRVTALESGFSWNARVFGSCRRWREPLLACAGMGPASSDFMKSLSDSQTPAKNGRGRGREQASALRHVYPGVERSAP
jgi:Protein of unknown function (DUF2924)